MRPFLLFLTLFALIAAGRANAQTESYLPPALSADDIPSISKYMGEDVTMTAEMVAFRPSWSPTAPNIITLRHEEKTLEVVFWTQDTDFDISPYQGGGGFVEVTGQVQNYRGRDQIKVSDLTKISLLEDNAVRARESSPAAQQTARSSKSSKSSPEKGKIEWQPYDHANFLMSKAEHGHAVLYIRCTDTEQARAFERKYLLTKNAPEFMGARTIFFLKHQDLEKHQELKVGELEDAPSLVVYQGVNPDSILTVSEEVSPLDIALFMKEMPR